MEHAEELFYHAFCTVVFCLAASLCFLLLKRYSDTMEAGRMFVAGDTSYQTGTHLEADKLIMGNEIIMSFYDELAENVEIDGVLFLRGGLYDVEENIYRTGQYEKQVLYENGVISRIVYRILK